MTTKTLSNSPQVHTGAAPAPDSIVSPIGPKLRVEVAFEDDQWVAQEVMTAMFGEGDTKDAAIADLMQTLGSLYSELNGHQADLAPRLKTQLRALRAVFGSL